MGFGSSLVDNVQAMGAAAINNTSNVSNSKTVYDLSGSTIYTRAQTAQTFFSDLPQQTMINGGGYS